MIEFDSENFYWTPENTETKNVHTEHCCVIHGCKYGESDCEVHLGRLTQSFPCETCETVGIEHIPKATMEEIKQRRKFFSWDATINRTNK